MCKSNHKNCVLHIMNCIPKLDDQVETFPILLSYLQFFITLKGLNDADFRILEKKETYELHKQR